jgi:hypothetical protein
LRLRPSWQVTNGTADMGAVEVQAPATFDATYTTAEDATLAKDAAGGVLRGATVPPLNAALTKGPSHGSLDLKLDGSFTYTPVKGFNGADGFAFAVSDSSGGAAVATATINVGMWLVALGPRAAGAGLGVQDAGQGGTPSALCLAPHRPRNPRQRQEGRLEKGRAQHNSPPCAA